MSDRLSLPLNGAFLDGSIGAALDVSIPSDVEIAKAIRDDSRLPVDSLDLTTADIGVSGGMDDIGFLGDRGSVSFKASGSAHANLSLHTNPDEVVGRVGLAEDLRDALELVGAGAPEGDLFSLLTWGYSAQAEGSGSVGLGTAGKVTFGAQTERERMYALIRRYGRDEGLGSVLSDTATSWGIPSRVATARALRPGTWIVVDIAGSLSFEVGGQVGYSFNWVREAKVGGLEGDIGLKLQTGLEAQLGFNTSGRFALLATRMAAPADDPDAEPVRLRVVRLSTKGWNFAFDVGASARADLGDFAPETADELVEAVLGVHPAQYLAALDELTDEGTDLAELLGDEAVDYGKKLLADVTGLDVEAEFEAARKLVLDLLAAWEEVPKDVSSYLWARLGDQDVAAYLAEAKEIVGTIREADSDEVRQLLEEQISKVEFFESPLGGLIRELAGDDLLAALVDEVPLEDIRERADKLMAVLDGGALEKGLARLHSVVSERLGVDRIRDEISRTDFEKLDAWFRRRLADFVGENDAFERLEELRATLRKFLSMRQELYQKTLEALQKEYSAKLSYAYQKATSKEALLDLEFDLAGEDARQAYEKAVSGRFDDLLIRKIEGVKLNKGRLSHGIRREARLSLSLPYYKSDEHTMSTSLGAVDAVDSKDGRLLMYRLEARDEVKNNGIRSSSLVLEGAIGVASPGVTTHSKPEFSYRYTFRQAVDDMKVDRLRYQVRPYVDRLMPSAFGTQGFDSWVAEMDRVAEQRLGRDTEDFGDTLLKLEVALPSSAAAAWLGAPSNERSIVYRGMSQRLQRTLKDLVLFYYFADPTKYAEDVDRVGILLTYASLPPRPYVNKHGEFIRMHWSENPDLRELSSSRNAAVRGGVTLDRMRQLLGDASRRLSAIPSLASHARRFAPDQAANIVRDVVETAALLAPLEDLIETERGIVNGARRAGTAMGKFMERNRDKPTKAVEELAKFGSEATQAFNSKLKGFFGEGALRPLGTMLFLECARALDQNLDSEIAAVLDVTIVREAEDRVASDSEGTDRYVLASYLDGKEPQPEDVVIRQRVTSVS